MSDPVGLLAAGVPGDGGGQGGAGARLSLTGVEAGPVGLLGALLVVLGALLLVARRAGLARRP